MAAAVLALGAAGLSLPSRREMLVSGAAAGLVSISPPATSAAGPALAASWSATDGFVEKSFIAFDEGAYAAMRDDEGRTPLFARAIKDRLAGTDDQTVLDVGTGPYALLALIAARAGAKKVYAIEASPEAAKRARAAIFAAKDVPPGVIEVIDGFSTEARRSHSSVAAVLSLPPSLPPSLSLSLHRHVSRAATCHASPRACPGLTGGEGRSRPRGDRRIGRLRGGPLRHDTRRAGAPCSVPRGCHVDAPTR